MPTLITIYIQDSVKGAVKSARDADKLQVQVIKEWAKAVVGHKLRVLVPDNWWKDYKSQNRKSYPVTKVDVTRQKSKGWYERDIFEFKDGPHPYHLNFEGLLGYLDPDTVPSSLALEDGLPWVNMPGTVSVFPRLSRI